MVLRTDPAPDGVIVVRAFVEPQNGQQRFDRRDGSIGHTDVLSIVGCVVAVLAGQRGRQDRAATPEAPQVQGQGSDHLSSIRASRASIRASSV